MLRRRDKRVEPERLSIGLLRDVDGEIDVAPGRQSPRDRAAEEVRELNLRRHAGERIAKGEKAAVVLLNAAPIAVAGRVLTSRQVLLDRAPFTRHLYESVTVRLFQDFRIHEHRLLAARYARA